MKPYIFAILAFIFLSIPVNAQLRSEFSDEFIQPETNNVSLRAATTYNSERGYIFPTKGTYRMLVIFINIIYDVTPQSNPNIVNHWGWEVNNQEGINQLPPTQYFNDIFDVNSTLPHQGYVTRFMSECSFESLVILGDFISVEINQSRIQPDGGSFNYSKIRNSVLTYINNNGGLQAIYGHNTIGDYDNATCGSNLSIDRVSNNELDYVTFLVLNPTLTHGGFKQGQGYSGGRFTTPKIKLSNSEFPIENWQMIAVGNSHMKHSPGLFIHELAHNLLGPNSFHTSGGNHVGTCETNTFIFKQEGYGLFSHSLRSCNAYERWRLGWQSSSNSPLKIAANGTNSDIQSKFTGTRTYYLRDFVTYGDAIRIKLPYKDNSASSNQYIWLENHQLGKNNKLDGLNYHFFPGVTCIPLGNPGIYSYIQVGKDVLEGSSSVVYPNNEKDNLRMINAEGNYNMRYLRNDYDCIGWVDRSTVEYLTPNPLSGKNDQTETIMPAGSSQTLQSYSDFSLVDNKVKNGVFYNQLIYGGDNFDGFEAGSIMNISSNPTPINASTYYAKYCNTTYTKTDDSRDTRKKYLTGLSIKMDYAYSLTNAGDVFKVDIRWDDYDVKNNVNWAGDIVLKEQLNLLPEKTITLEQNLTPDQHTRDAVSGVFALSTKLTCENGSVFTMKPNSKTILKDKSSVIMLSASSLTVQNGAQIVVEPGSTFMVKNGANLTIQGNGKLLIKPGGYLCIEQGANVKLQDYNSIISMQQGAIYGANPALFSSSSCLSSIPFTGNGKLINCDQEVYIQNETISTNRYIGGKNIYVGKAVTTAKPQGDVLINNGVNVIFDAQNVTFDDGFESQLGGLFEIINEGCASN